MKTVNESRGYVALQSGKKAEIKQVKQKLTDKYIKLMGYPDPDWKPLVQLEK